MKRQQWVVLIAAALGAAALRLVQLRTGFDADGLAVRGCFAAVALPLLLAAAAVYFLLSSRSFTVRRETGGTMRDSFFFDGAPCLFCCGAGAVLVLLSCVLAFLGDRSPLGLLLLILGLCAGLAVLYAVRTLRRGDPFALGGVALLAPVCFLVLQLALLYRTSAADPVLARTYVPLLALAALTFSSLERAAFAFTPGAPRRYVPAAATAVVLTLCALADLPALPVSAGLAGFALIELGFLGAADFDW